jgi:hypothetical protein
MVGLISFFICSPAHCQKKNPLMEIDSLIQKGDEFQFQNFSSADSLYEVAADKIRTLGIDAQPTVWIRLLHQRSFTALFHNKIVASRKYLKDAYESLNRYENIPGGQFDSLKAQTQVIEANYFYVVGSYTNALANLGEAETYLRHQQKTETACETLYQILQFQASVYYLQGEFESCIDRYLGSIEYYDCYRPKTKYASYILVNRNIGLAYLAMGNSSKARTYFFAAKANLDSCPARFKDFTVRNHALVLYNSMAEFYRVQKQIDSAKYFFRQALPILGENPNYISRVNEGLAKVAVTEKDFIAAHALFNKSLTHTVQVRGEKNYITSNLYRSISSLYYEEQDSRNALLFIQKALNSLSSSASLDEHDYASNPPLSSLQIHKQTVMTLHQKATTLASLYQRLRSDSHLVAARKTNRLALQFIDSARNEFSLDKDKVVLGEDAAKVYQTGLYLSSTLYRQTKDIRYLSECFELMDKSKSAVLMDHIKFIKRFSGLPSELMNRERELKVELSIAEQQLYTAEIKNEETSHHRQHLGQIKTAYTSQTIINSELKTIR